MVNIDKIFVHNNYNGKFICYVINSKHDLFAENPKI